MKKLTCILLCLASTTLCSQSVHSLLPVSKPEIAGMSTARLARIDKMVNDYIDRNLIPGATVIIVRNGGIVYHKAFGLSDKDSNVAMKKDDIFRMASQTKAITSLAVMMLFEEGKFFLDDPVSKFIPEYKNQLVLKTFNAGDTTYTTEPAKRDITIRQLLTHTSGIDYPVIGSEEFTAIYHKAGIPTGIGTDEFILSQKMKALGKLPLRHQPGERFTYGLNTDLLGYLVEVWSGMSLNDFFHKRIFQPLGMKDTDFYLPAEKHSRVVPLYQGSGTDLKKVAGKAFDNANPDYPKLNGSYYSGGAGLSGTIEDYARFLQLFLNKGEFNRVRLLSRKTVELMLTDQLSQPNTPDVGLGFGLETSTNDHQSIMSIGSFQWGGAFNTSYWADPSEKLIGLLYTNIYQTKAGDIGERFKILTYQAIID
jgi:CubicO group peptidase (beta-lactamase class C family)